MGLTLFSLIFGFCGAAEPPAAETHPLLFSGIQLREINPDEEIARERNKALEKLQEEALELWGLGQGLSELIGDQAQQLNGVEEVAQKTEETTQTATETISEAAQIKQKQSSFLKKLLLQDGVPVGAGAAAGTSIFFAAKAALLAVPLIPTAIPVLVPAMLAVATGGGAWIGGKYIMHKLVPDK